MDGGGVGWGGGVGDTTGGVDGGGGGGGDVFVGAVAVALGDDGGEAVDGAVVVVRSSLSLSEEVVDVEFASSQCLANTFLRMYL